MVAREWKERRKKKEKLKESKGSGLALSGENLIKPLSGCVCEREGNEKLIERWGMEGKKKINEKILSY